MDLRLQLEGNKNKKSINKDLYQRLKFENTSIIIPTSDINDTINTYKTFEDERNSATKYRLTVTLNPIMSNALTNKLTEIIPISGGAALIGDDRLKRIQTIDDVNFQYHLGYDIFDNNFMRVDSFKTGNTLNNFLGKQLYNVSSIEKASKANLIEDNGWVCISNKTKINGVKMFSSKEPCEKIDLFPTRNQLLFKPTYINNESRDNWSYALTYPYANYTDSVLTKSISGTTGIPIINMVVVSLNQNKYLEITTAYKHGMNYNDVVKIKSDGLNNQNTYLVYDIGDFEGNDKEHKILLDANKYTDLIAYAGNTDCRIVRIVDKVESDYYIRKFRKIPNFLDETDIITENNIKEKIEQMDSSANVFMYESYQPGFARNIYNDAMYQFQYIDDINIALLKDNLQRPLTEIYFTIIKKNIIDSSVDEPYKHFTKVVSGIDEPTGTTNFSNIRIINNVDNMEIGLEENITITGSTIDGVQCNNIFLGDIVEYNRNTAKEIVLDDVQHRFNTVQREMTNDFIYNDILGDTANLLINSSLTQDKKYWNGHNADISVSTSTQLVDGDVVNCLIINNQIAGNDAGCFHNQPIVYEKDQTYNISFWARAHNLGVTLDLVGVEGLNGTETYSFPLNEYWTQHTMEFIGDGKIHNLIFYTKIANGSKEFYITKIKVEKNSQVTSWKLHPTEGTYNFINKTIKLDPLREGYYYKPHYKIQLKNYSSVISKGELIEVIPCGDFDYCVTTARTETGEYIIKEKNLCTDDEVKSLIFNSYITTGLTNYDIVRFTKKDNKEFINLKINVYFGGQNSIIVPYDKEFFGSISQLTIYDYVIRKYSSSSIPLYCQDNYDGTCLWREILREGVFDSESFKTTESVFTNGSLYLNEMFNFYLKRQDPFGYYGIRNNKFPSDLYGYHDVANISNNVIEKANNIC